VVNIARGNSIVSCSWSAACAGRWAAPEHKQQVAKSVNQKYNTSYDSTFAAAREGPRTLTTADNQGLVLGARRTAPSQPLGVAGLEGIAWISASAVSVADRCQERGHQFAQGLSLRQSGTDEASQSPQALGLGGPTPERRAAFEIQLELLLKLVQED